MGQSLSSKFLKFPDVLLKNIRITIEESMEAIETEAAKTHRYNIGSSNLSKAFAKVMHNDLFGEIFLDGSVSGAEKYAYAIHEGHSGPATKANVGFQTWRRDRFLTKAGKKLEKGIIEKLAEAAKDSKEKVFGK